MSSSTTNTTTSESSGSSTASSPATSSSSSTTPSDTSSSTTTSTTTSSTSTSATTANGYNDYEAYTNICPDGHACDNDSSCVESLLHENKYVCDCRDAYQQTGKVFAGLSCQHAATEYCTVTGEISTISYCVNQGKCLSKIDTTATQEDNPKMEHAGCSCPKEYTGTHCQYIAGSKPDDMSYFFDGTTFAQQMAIARAELAGGDGTPINPAAIIVPILLVTFGAVGYIVWKYRGFDSIIMKFSRNSEKHIIDKTKKADENMLDADGSASIYHSGNNKSLNAIDFANGRNNGGGSSYRRNSTPAFSACHKAALMDPPDFDDLLEQSDHVQFHMDPTGTATHKLFASDPTLHYNPTSDTTGTGSPTSIGSGGEDESVSSTSPTHSTTPRISPGAASGAGEIDYNEDLENSPTDFEEFDPNDFSMRGSTKAGTARFDDPTFT